MQKRGFSPKLIGDYWNNAGSDTALHHTPPIIDRSTHGTADSSYIDPRNPPTRPPVRSCGRNHYNGDQVERSRCWAACCSLAPPHGPGHTTFRRPAAMRPRPTQGASAETLCCGVQEARPPLPPLLPPPSCGRRASHGQMTPRPGIQQQQQWRRRSSTIGSSRTRSRIPATPASGPPRSSSSRRGC